MKLSKAKELNKDVEKSLREGKRPDHADAVAIGIEAIAFIELSRVTTPGSVPTLLNGETED